MMRAMFVLLTILTVATPQVSWGSFERPSAYASMSIAAPAVGSQLARVTAKIDKTFGFGLAIDTERVALLPPFGAFDQRPLTIVDAPNVVLDSPPLAPRPPPQAGGLAG